MIRFINHGSVWLAVPDTDEELDHLFDNTSAETQWVGTSVVVEPRYVESLAQQLEENGFETEWGP